MGKAKTCAFCWRNGVIEIGKEADVPEGAIVFARGSKRLLADICEVRSRLAYDGVTLLVPGIPEAEDDDAALDALEDWVSWAFQEHPRDKDGRPKVGRK